VELCLRVDFDGNLIEIVNEIDFEGLREDFLRISASF
jgi:hypothetical protein